MNYNHNHEHDTVAINEIIEISAALLLSIISTADWTVALLQLRAHAGLAALMGILLTIASIITEIILIYRAKKILRIFR